jgi:hypothetical protein
LLPKFRMLLARFAYGGIERTEIVEWTATASLWAARQPDITGGLLQWHIDDTPVTMCRNRAVLAAIENDVDILVLIDSDMSPDIDKNTPFLPRAFEFIKSRWHIAPTIISAPYCTAAPAYNPVMGIWRKYRDGFEVKSDLYTREEAEVLKGIQPCPLQGTGLMAIDMRVFTGFAVGAEMVKLAPPWFYYEYKDSYHAEKVSTEDMVFTRNVTLEFAKHDLEIGFVDWDCWAYHVKTEFVGKPHTLTVRDIAQLRKE